MPGSERTAGSISIARLMEPEGLSEEELFAPRPEELPRIRNGTVTLIPLEDKQRVLDLLQEVLRFRIDLGYLTSHLRGDAYLRTRRAWGEDFCYVSTQPTEHLSNVPVAALATCCDSVLVCRGSNASLFCCISLGWFLLLVVSIPTGILFGCVLIPVCTGSHSGVVPVYGFA